MRLQSSQASASLLVHAEWQLPHAEHLLAALATLVQVLIAALQVMVSCCSARTAMPAKRSNAICHSPAFSQALLPR